MGAENESVRQGLVALLVGIAENENLMVDDRLSAARILVDLLTRPMGVQSGGRNG